MKLQDVVIVEDEFAKQSVEVSGSTENQLARIEQMMKILVAYQNRALKALNAFQEGTRRCMLSQWATGFEELMATSPYHGEYCDSNLDYFTSSRPPKAKKFVIDPATPNIEKMWPRIKEITERSTRYANQYRGLLKQQTTLKKAAREQAKTEDDTPSTTPIASKAEIKKIQKSLPRIKIGKKNLGNPLTSCDRALYAGPPNKYPDLTTSQFDIFLKIQKALKQAGLQPITTLYGGRTHRNYINFIAVNADSTFAWKKSQHGAQDGQNFVYLPDGSKAKTSWFIDDPVGYLKGDPEPDENYDEDDDTV